MRSCNDLEYVSESVIFFDDDDYRNWRERERRCVGVEFVDIRNLVTFFSQPINFFFFNFASNHFLLYNSNSAQSEIPHLIIQKNPPKFCKKLANFNFFHFFRNRSIHTLDFLRGTNEGHIPETRMRTTAIDIGKP